MPGTIAIAGGGIGGLAAALSIARAGVEVQIFERADGLREVGAGLQMSPNASRILREIGAGEALDSLAVCPRELVVHEARTGRILNRMDLDEAAARHGAPYWVVHRADLQRALAEAAFAHPAITIRLEAAVRDVRETETGVEITLGDGETVGADALVAADGVWSTIRRDVLGLPGAAYSNRTSWRAVVPIDAVPDRFRDVTGLWLGHDAHLVHYPVHAGRKFNIVAVVADDWKEETWNAPGDPDFLKKRFADWAPTVQYLLSMTDTWLKWALCGMPPAGHPWHRGRIALLGDAAHAMLPFLAQGAAMAIEDGAVLAAELANGGRIEDAFARYEARRRPRVERVVAAASKNDCIYHASGPMAFARDTALKLMPSRLFLSHYDWLYGWRA